MMKVIYPITWLAGREGEIADVIHDIAVEMMEHRADLLRNATWVKEGEFPVYLKQARLLEEYATVMNAIYYQLEPEKWNQEMAGDILELAQEHHISLPGWMKTGKMPGNAKETTEVAVERFSDEGERIPTDLIDLPQRS